MFWAKMSKGTLEKLVPRTTRVSVGSRALLALAAAIMPWRASDLRHQIEEKV